MHAQYEQEKRVLSERSLAEAQKLKDDKKDMIAQFQLMVEEQRSKMDQELQQNAEMVCSPPHPSILPLMYAAIISNIANNCRRARN